MALRSVTALSELNHNIDATFSNIEQFERFDRYTTLQSLCTALDHQVEDGLMRQQECDRMRFVGKSWDLKLQIHWLEKGCTQLAGVIYCTHYIIDVGFVLGGCNSKIAVCLCLFTAVRCSAW